MSKDKDTFISNLFIKKEFTLFTIKIVWKLMTNRAKVVLKFGIVSIIQVLVIELTLWVIVTMTQAANILI